MPRPSTIVIPLPQRPHLLASSAHPGCGLAHPPLDPQRIPTSSLQPIPPSRLSKPPTLAVAPPTLLWPRPCPEAPPPSPVKSSWSKADSRVGPKRFLETCSSDCSFSAQLGTRIGQAGRALSLPRFLPSTSGPWHTLVLVLSSAPPNLPTATPCSSSGVSSRPSPPLLLPLHQGPS